jgi:hypothetical protein
LEAFELIRKSAGQLHDDLVRAGADPFQPLALVQAAIASLDLDFVFLPPGDPALKGGKALLDEQTGTIRCEDAGSPVDRALLIAHEIGHVRIHAGSSACTAEDIDPSRSAEAAPVGLQRVEDYGVRERRELQANVFARELVFPRTLARRLHHDEALSASDIAKRSGLPLALVRQQIFDALLLPAAPPPAEVRPAATPHPDPAQDRAAAHRGAPFQLQAGASLPIPGLTAWQGLFQHGRLQAGQSVVAHGAAGAVGSMVTQLAREAGAYVIGTGRAGDRQKVLDFGANEFLDLENEALEDIGRVDLVFDVIGGDIQKRSAGLVRAGGTLVSVVGPAESRPADGLAVDFVVEADRAHLSEIVQRVRDGRLQTNLGKISVFDEAVATFNSAERRAGKTVICVRP